jgi:predicted transcriptional regulator
MRKTLQQLVIEVLAKSKTGLVNSQIAEAVMKKRPSTSYTSIDSTLTQASKKGVIQKKPTLGTMGKSKFVYSVEKAPSVRKVLQEALKATDRLDSQEVASVVRSILPGATKANIDATLFQMAKRGELIKSKTLMTDNNVTSDASKYVYTGVKTK